MNKRIKSNINLTHITEATILQIMTVEKASDSVK